MLLSQQAKATQVVLNFQPKIVGKLQGGWRKREKKNRKIPL